MKLKFISFLFIVLITSCTTTKLTVDTNAKKENDLTFSKLEINFNTSNGLTHIKFINVKQDDYYLNLVNNSKLFETEYPLRLFSLMSESYKVSFNKSINIEISLKAINAYNSSIESNIEKIITTFTKQDVTVGINFSYTHGVDTIILVFDEDDKFYYQKGNAIGLYYNENEHKIALFYDIINKPIKFRVNIKN